MYPCKSVVLQISFGIVTFNGACTLPSIFGVRRVPVIDFELLFDYTT